MDPNPKQQEQMIVRVEEFLNRHVTRLSGVLDQYAASLAQQETVQQLADELLRQTAEWERQREVEASQIEQEHSRLIAAWEQLEAEERRLAAQAETLRLDRNSGGSVKSAYERTGGDSSPATPLPATESRSLVFDRATQSANSREQFERLKREIRNHARRAGGAEC